MIEKNSEIAMDMDRSNSRHAQKNIPLHQESFFSQPLLCLKAQFRVWHALMLHDIKSRFFGNGLGYIVMIIWPMGHIVILLLLNGGRLAPHGSSMILYVCTGVVPFICFNYMGRFIMLSSVTNKTFLSYTLIQPLDIMIARMLLEIITNYIILVVLLTALYLSGIDITPIRPVDAAEAWLASLFLGIGFGFVNAIIAMAFPFWIAISIVFFLGAWVTSGVVMDPELLPAPYGYYMSFNPLLHAVEWMRQAYYPNFSAHLLNKPYLLLFSFSCFFIGLMAARFGRSILLHPR